MRKLVFFLGCLLIWVMGHAQIQTGVFRTPAGNTNYHQLTRTGGGAAVYINQTDSSNLILRLASKTATAGGGLVLTVQNDGSVGIGTMAPKEKLSVKGNIMAKEIKVTTAATDWPDYVFDNNYRLSPLDELEKEILTLGHLPGMPDAAQVAKDGVRLGEVSRLLTEKVEELTLHAIGQQKLVDEQRVQLEKQQEQLQELSRRLETLEQATGKQRQGNRKKRQHLSSHHNN